MSCLTMLLPIFSVIVLRSGVGEAASIYPSTATVDDARLKITAVIDNNVKNGNERPFIAGLVRLAFHDCVGDGGCDGCIDHDNDSNKGLQKYTNKLDAAFDLLTSGTMSRADFYVLAGYVALEKATEGQRDTQRGSQVFNAVPKFGREDCPTSPDEADEANEVFPDAKWNLPQIEAFFANDNFLFDRNDVAAILGAHSLGRASVSNSGYEGKWIQNMHRLGRAHSDVLDNSYYTQILRNADNANLDNHWRQVNVVSGTNKQWQQRNQVNEAATLDAEGFPVNRQQRNMFLNVDMCLRWNLNGVDSTGQAACTHETCEDSDALVYIQGFAARQGGNEAFIAAFEIAFEKMVESKENETLI